MSNFPVGSLVRLRSGGPTMTVNDMEDDYRECAWFDGSALTVIRFSVAALEDAGATVVAELQHPVWPSRIIPRDAVKEDK